MTDRQADSGGRQGERQRDFALDLLRALAITEVVLAHTSLPPLLAQLRSFGMPLLLVVSGMSFATASRGREVRLGPHLRRRFRRLVLPSWGFLSFYMGLRWLLAPTGLLDAPGSLRDIAAAYLFLSGYLWVVRVNLLVALFAPLLLRLERWAESDWLLLGCVMALLVVNEGLLTLYPVGEEWSGFTGGALLSSAYFTLSYGAMFLLGMRVPAMSGPRLLGLSAAFFGLYGLTALNNLVLYAHYYQTELWKTPPQLYYIGYALGVTLLIIRFRGGLAAAIGMGWPRRVLGFVGQNTLWVYLWHILALDVIRRLAEEGLLPGHFLVQWPLILGLAVGATALQKLVAGPALRAALHSAARPTKQAANPETE